MLETHTPVQQIVFQMIFFDRVLIRKKYFIMCQYYIFDIGQYSVIANTVV